MLHNVGGRKTTSLDGEWRVIVDPYENGYYDYRYQPHQTEGYFRDRKAESKSDRVEYDFDASGTLAVPGDWNSQRPELFLYEGTVWYRQTFSYDLLPGRRLFVHFGAANYHARVYVDGREIGEHQGGFTPFAFEITDRIGPSIPSETASPSEAASRVHSLVVQVDNRRRKDAVPALNTDWWNYGGLTREVALVDVPETFIEDYFIALDPGSDAGSAGHGAASAGTDAGSAQIVGWVHLTGPRRAQKVSVRIPDADTVVAIETGADGYAPFSCEASVKRWTPERPSRYEIAIEAETDRVVDRVGFRTIATRGSDILLNGEPIFLRGISIHEQAPVRPGRAFSEADARTLLGWAKKLGANFVRLAHYPHNEHMARVADELGLLVWAEIPVYWTIDWDNPATLDGARQQLSELIGRDKNRPSVIIWSVGNETPVTPARLRFMTSLVGVARALDPSRLVSAALERHTIGDDVQMIDDPLGNALDVIGCNEYLGWYDGLPDKADGMSWRTTHDKPLIMSEFGADALQGHHGDALTRWTEEFQASVYRHQIAMLSRIPFLRGMTPWILADFRSPRRPLPKIQDFWNRKGLISDQGIEKQAFFVLQAHYRERAGTLKA